MDGVFGPENFIGVIAFKKTGYQAAGLLPSNYDYMCWYARNKEMVKYRQIHVSKLETSAFVGQDLWVELPDGSRRRMTKAEVEGEDPIPKGSRVFRHKLAEGAGSSGNTEPFEFEGRVFKPKEGKHWSTTPDGMRNLAKNRRFIIIGNSLRFVNYLDDFPVGPITTVWPDTVVSGFADPQLYVVQTSTKAVQRCLLMTTDPGDLVLDPTCGSGTTAYVAEQWGRRWITIDTSRVPLALARQRLLTNTFDYYELKDEQRGPAAGFVYKRKQNNKGEEVGGIVPHLMLKNIANNELPAEEVLVDRPEVKSGIIRVAGPFVFEATIPTPVDVDGDGIEDSGAAEQYGSFVERMLEILRHSPVLEVGGGRKVNLRNVRPPAKTLSLSAEAMVANGQEKPIAIVFGPENGAVSERLVHEAAKEANLKSYAHLYVIGFAIQPNARNLVDNCEAVAGIPATYVTATPDLMMGDLLKNMRSSQIFSVCGLPEIEVRSEAGKDGKQYQVELLGLDVFDPVTMEVVHHKGDDVPAWFLDTDYNDLCFHVCQAFFPRTGAWENLKKALKSTHSEAVWDHLAGATSAPFEAGEHGQVAVKVIDDRGNELVVVKKLGGEGK